jgi:hypothetical protein
MNKQTAFLKGNAADWSKCNFYTICVYTIMPSNLDHVELVYAREWLAFTTLLGQCTLSFSEHILPVYRTIEVHFHEEAEIFLIEK